MKDKVLPEIKVAEAKYEELQVKRQVRISNYEVMYQNTKSIKMRAMRFHLYLHIKFLLLFFISCSTAEISGK